MRQALMALTAPMALRSMQGICTRPPMGSQVIPRLCSMPISAACSTSSLAPSRAATKPAAAMEQATPTSDLYETTDGVAGHPEIVLHADFGSVFHLFVGAVQGGDQTGRGHGTGHADFRSVRDHRWGRRSSRDCAPCRFRQRVPPLRWRRPGRRPNRPRPWNRPRRLQIGTRPPMGSQVIPRLCSMPISAACSTSSLAPSRAATKPAAAMEQATPTSDLYETTDGVAGHPEIVLHADFGSVFHLFVGAVQGGDQTGRGHGTGHADF